jgi:predicted dehydrogenase
MQAYKDLDNMRLVAACDMDAKRLRNAGAKFGVPGLYTDLDDMLRNEKPDVLHIVTPPTIREGPVEQAGRAGVKGIIIEKPVALNGPQAATIAALAKQYGLKIAVNTQRRYASNCQALRGILAENRIGDVLFVRGAARGNILSMGPHLLDLLEFFLNDLPPKTIWACAHGMNGYDYKHPAPAKILARYVYPNGVTAYIEDAEDAVCTPGETSFWQHHRLDFWGSKGRAWYVQNHTWGYQAEGMATPVVEAVPWSDEDLTGQRGLTRAMGEWLADDQRPHGNRLENSLLQFNMFMATMLSIHERRPVEFPTAVPADIVATVETELKR